MLEKAEKRDERLGQVWSKNPEKALQIEKNIQWKKALSRAEGQKVKVRPHGNLFYCITIFLKF